jgi:hypothetical protein
MADIGAMAAYLDREGLSRSVLYWAYGLTGLAFYALFLGSSHLWTVLIFGNRLYSGDVN